MEALDENSLNSCCLNCRVSLIDLIHVSRLILGLIYWVMRYLVILSIWCGIRGNLRGLEMKIEEEKSKVPSDNPWGAAPARVPQGRLCLIGPGAPRQRERLRPESVRLALVLRASQSAKTPLRPRSFPIFSY